MTSLFERLAGKLINNRSRLPSWMRKLMESVAQHPDGLISRISARLLGVASSPNTVVPTNPTRVYIAPTNYSGQGHLWARALEATDTTIGARNVAVTLPGGFSFKADTLVPIATVNSSAEWAEAEWQAASKFTHVLVEAERSMFGKRFARNLEAEVEALEGAGVSVAFICHGTDIRNPSLHSKTATWSPYPEDPRTDRLQRDAEENLALLKRMSKPVFISTPDLEADVPWGYWCPVIADIPRFANPDAEPVLSNEQVRVIHVSSDPLQKGSNRIEPALAPLIAAGKIDYEVIAGVPWAEMPGVIGSADIVLDQFRLGSYGVAACEAMAAGRVVVGHVRPDVRERIEKETGLNLPIVEAEPHTLAEVVAELIANPEQSREIAKAGLAYVAAVHSGEMSARVLIDHWIGARQA